MVGRGSEIEGDGHDKKKAGRDCRPAPTHEEVVASAFDGVDTLSVALEGPNFQAQLLLQLAADEPSYAVSLPSGRAHDGLQCGPARLLQQRDHFRRLGAVPPRLSR